jgi:tetratricopeptide (TPR) repeat protein
LGSFPKAETDVYPSPDGKWVVLRATAPDEQGSLTEGSSTLLLVSVAERSVRTLCRKDGSLVFGDTTGIVSWSADSRRFVFSAKIRVRSDEGQLAQFLYDLEAGAFVDVCQDDALADAWQGDSLYLKKLDIRQHVDQWFRWRAGAAPEPCDVPARRSPDDRFEISVGGSLTIVDLEASSSNATRTVALDRARSFKTFWAGSCLVDEGLDARVLDLQRLTWRYLAPREAGEPKTVAPFGRAVLFQSDDGWTMGSAERPAPTFPSHEWPNAKPERVAVASAHAGDEARATSAAESAGGAAPRTVREILRHRHAAAAFERGLATDDAVEERDAFLEAVRLDPEWSDAHQNLTLAYHRAHDFDGMLSAAEAWCRVFPECAEAHVDRSIALQNLGRHADAIAAVENAIRLAPDVSLAHYQHACALAKAGRRHDALAAAERAADLDRTSVVAIGLEDDLEALRGSSGFARFEAAAWLHRGEQFYRARDAGAACDAFRRSAAFEPSRQACHNWCVLALGAKQPEDALAATDLWLKENPEAYAFELRCRAMMMLDRNDEAAQVAEAAVEKKMVEPRGLGALAAAFARVKNTERCLRLLERMAEDDAEAAVTFMEQAPALEYLRTSGGLETLLSSAKSALAHREPAGE